jgi:hypothetical protein
MLDEEVEIEVEGCGGLDDVHLAVQQRKCGSDTEESLTQGVSVLVEVVAGLGTEVDGSFVDEVLEDFEDVAEELLVDKMCETSETNFKVSA